MSTINVRPQDIRTNTRVRILHNTVAAGIIKVVNSERANKRLTMTRLPTKYTRTRATYCAHQSISSCGQYV